MASQKTLVNRYIQHSGLDFKSSDLTREATFASDMLNAQYKKTGAIEKRQGYKGAIESLQSRGLFTYNKVDLATNNIEPILLTVSDKLLCAESTTFVVAYSGAETLCTIEIVFIPEESEYKCQIIEGITTVLDFSLGVGIDEATPVDLADLKAAIDALTGFSATITGSNTIPASFLDTVINFDLIASNLTITAKEFVDCNTPLSAPLSGTETNQNTSNFVNPTFCQIQNVAYVSNGYDYIHKYDGQNSYRAGVPQVEITGLNLAAGAITGGPYQYQTQVIQVDAQGNFTEGNIYTFATTVSPSSQNVEVTFENVLANSGFNTNCAIAVGAHVSVNTINVDNGAGGNHTLKVGDTAYFFDSISSAYVEREVTSITTTTIVIAGAAVTVADNAVISNNLRIAIYRNKTVLGAITTWYLVAELPNNSFASTQVYTDSAVDAAITVPIIPPLTDRSPPPKGLYITSFKNHLMLAGDFENPSRLYWSDVESPEYFDINRFAIDLDTISGDIITGLSPNNEIFVIFKNQSIHILSGDLAALNIRVESISNDIGCVAHHTISEIRGVLFFLSDVGPKRMTGGQLPIALGASQLNPFASRIDPVFEQIGLTDDLNYVLKRAVAVNDRLKEKYILCIPCESTTTGNLHANANTVCFVYDYSRDAWLKWNNMDLTSGVTLFDGNLFWLERRFSVFNDQTDSVCYERHNLNDAHDYNDNTVPVNFSYSTGWEAMNEPSILKKFLNIKIYSIEETQNNSMVISVQTEGNYASGNLKSSFDFDFGISGYGASAYGIDPYGDVFEGSKKHKLSSERLRSMRVIFLNDNAQENVIVTGWELEIAAPYKVGMKV